MLTTQEKIQHLKEVRGDLLSRHNCLCTSSFYIDKSWVLYLWFTKELKKDALNFSHWYEVGTHQVIAPCDGITAFYWHPDDKQSRLDYLDTKIKELENQ